MKQSNHRDMHAILLPMCRHGYGSHDERLVGIEKCVSISDSRTGLDFALFHSRTGYIASFRLVESSTTSIIDLDWSKKDFLTAVSPCQVGSGILDIYLNLREEIIDVVSAEVRFGRSLVCCGYSTGGAIASIACVDGGVFANYSPRLVLYGAPFPGDKNFSATLRERCLAVSDFLVADDPVRYFPTDAPSCRFSAPVSLIGCDWYGSRLSVRKLIYKLWRGLFPAPGGYGRLLMEDQGLSLAHDLYYYSAASKMVD